MKIKSILIIISLVFAVSCVSQRHTRNPFLPENKVLHKINVSSRSFTDGGDIPEKHTCYGEDISPHLKWDSIPPETESFVVIAEDPTAFMSNWAHWVVYDIPPQITELEENIKASRVLAGGIKQGENEFLDIGYKGPCPKIRTHTYYFNVFALDSKPELDFGLKRSELRKKIREHIIGYGFITGKY